jgi:hypothetical protein
VIAVDDDGAAAPAGHAIFELAGASRVICDNQAVNLEHHFHPRRSSTVAERPAQSDMDEA